MDHYEFSNFLNERLRERGLNTKRLSELTGVSVRHLEAILSGNPEHLPPLPYLKGYLLKLAQILDFDANEAWEQMKKFAAAKSSGKSDEPAKNRFSKKPVGGYMTVAVVLLAVILYAGFRFYKISGTPVITVSYPSENMAVVNESSVLLSGSVSNSDELKINGEQVQVGQNGEWQKNVSLQQGINTVELTAKKFLGRETKILRQIVYQPAQTAQPAATGTKPFENVQNPGF